jgi:catechol 2,3-dioxygenase-like lactoylglutathione lyase family enzyme
MATFALHHVQLAIPTDGEDRAREFYSGLLGLTEVDKPPVLATRGGCWFRSGTLEVHLGVEDPFSPARKAHPGILVSDGFDDLITRLAEASVKTTEDDNFPGYRRVHLFDPFGNRLEVMTPDAPTSG